MDTTIPAKQRFQEIIDKMPDDATREQIWNTIDTWYHIDKARANDNPSIPHEEAKKIMADRLKKKLANES